MNKTIALLLASWFLALDSSAAERGKRVVMEDLPPAVQVSVKQELQNAKLLALFAGGEPGTPSYKMETDLHGKTRYVTFDAEGKTVEVEEEVAMETVPRAAVEAILKAVGDGKLRKIEKVTNGSTMYYEGELTLASGKHAHVHVAEDGSPVK